MIRAALIALLLAAAPIAGASAQEGEYNLRLTANEINYLIRLMQGTPLVYLDWAPIAEKIQRQTAAQNEAARTPPPNTLTPVPNTPPPRR